jgi:cyclophilin family peptidyl-prolyl cis-trans isomerase
VIGLAASAYVLTKPNDSAPPAETAVAPTPTESAAAGATAPTSGQPDLTVDEAGLSKAVVTIETDKGMIKFRFYAKDAPNTVARIVQLIQSNFYNGLTFHRVVPDFVIQGGDPNGNGTGGSGQKLKAEFNSRKHVEGTVAMARANDPDSADSQFYIALGPIPHLDGSYTVFGQVSEGLEVMKKIVIGDKMTKVTVQ